MQSQDAVVAKRTDEGSPDTEEIRRLTEAAGHEVVAEVTQTRPADSTLQFGRGKAEELAETVAETGAGLVVFDNDLTPTQTVELADRCPDGTRVVDRHRLVLDIFETRAGTERARLQVERATLEWNLPRIRESTDEQALNRLTESGTRYYDVLDRIDELGRRLSDLGDEAAARRERRREEGFEFVALAGYTNAGKSTLLHRLADDLDFEARDPAHADLDGTAEVRDRLFETLDTTTRRATVDGRRTLATDTVGFVDDLPHELVASFHGTLSATGDADCVVLVADASDPPAELRRKVETSLDILDGTGGELVVALNKADLLADGELAECEAVVREAVSEAAVGGAGSDSPTDAATDPLGTADPFGVADPVAISATEGRNLDALRDRIASALPNRRETELRLPNDDAAMSLVSWLYDRADVRDVTYRDEAVRVAFAAKPSVVERAEARAERLESEVGA